MVTGSDFQATPQNPKERGTCGDERQDSVVQPLLGSELGLWLRLQQRLRPPVVCRIVERAYRYSGAMSRLGA